MIFPDYDRQCGWYEVLKNVSDFPPLKEDIVADVAIVGGGFVGMAAARRLAENLPDGRIVLLEALKFGQGASGRNSGFVIDLPHKRDLELATSDAQQRIIRLNHAAIDYLEEQIKTHHIDCQWSAAGKYQAAVGERGERYLQHYERLLRQTGQAYQYLKRQELAPIFGTDFYCSAIYTPGGMLMQPAALMRGLADSMPSNVTLAEHSPVSSLRRDQEWYRLQTPQAEVKAKKIILATSAFTAEFGYMKNRILPVMTFASWTSPLSDQDMQKYAGQLDWGITPADHAGTTVRMTQDRRLLIRNSYRYAYDYNTSAAQLQKAVRNHRASFLARYPSLEHIQFEHTWGGTTSLSGNFQTFFGQVDDGVYTACCDQSVGAARGTISGKLLADLITERPSQQLNDIQTVSGYPSVLPPRPLLRIGVPIRMKIAHLSSRSEL